MQSTDPQAPQGTPTPSEPYTDPPVAVPPVVQPPASLPVQPVVQQPQAAVAPVEVVPSTPVSDTPPSESVTEGPEEESDQGPTSLPEAEPVTWQAEEYLQHDKTPLWYIGFTVVVVAFMGLAIWLSAWTFVVLIPVMAVALMVYTHRPARLVNYTVSSNGFHINDQLHPMGEFKAFGVVQDNEVNTLMLIPVKRFRPGINVYFPTEIGESLVDVLGAYLPMQELHPDVFDKIIRKLHI